MSKVFAWVRGLRGPEPQIISDDAEDFALALSGRLVKGYISRRYDPEAG
jgi:hypothetical protein